MSDTVETATARLAKIRAEIEKSGAGRDAKTRRAAEKKQQKAVGDRRALRQTGRDALFNFRAHPGMHPACKAAAAAKGLKLAEWMEAALIAKLEAEGRDTSFVGVVV
jgi:hypothetical protein